MGAVFEGDPLARHSLSPRELKGLIDAEREGSPFLVYRDDLGALRCHLLADAGRRLAIGRREGAEVRLEWDGQVSGIHAELECVAGEWTIVDDGLSRNGTFINARRCTGRQRLRDGDRLRVGQTLIAFNAGSQPRPAETWIGPDNSEAERLSDTQRRILVALCRPQIAGGEFHAPATNRQIAEEVFLGVDAVKLQLRTMFGRFGLDRLPQNQKRAGLAEHALRSGLVSPRDLE